MGGLEPGLVSRPTNGRENQLSSAPATARLLFKHLPPCLISLWLCHAPSFPAFLVSPTAQVPVATPQRQSRYHGCSVPPRPAVSDPQPGAHSALHLPGCLRLFPILGRDWQGGCLSVWVSRWCSPRPAARPRPCRVSHPASVLFCPSLPACALFCHSPPPPSSPLPSRALSLEIISLPDIILSD